MTHLTRIVYSIWLLSALAFGAEKAVPPTFTPPDLELIHPVYYPPDSPEHPNNRAKLEGLTAHVARRAEKPQLSLELREALDDVREHGRALGWLQCAACMKEPGTNRCKKQIADAVKTINKLVPESR